VWGACGAVVDVVGLGVVVAVWGACGALVDVVGLGVLVGVWWAVVDFVVLWVVVAVVPPPKGPKGGAVVDVVGIWVVVEVGPPCGAVLEVVKFGNVVS